MSEPSAEIRVSVEELQFEDAYQELSRAVEALERGDLPLEQTLAVYERGVALADRCAQLLVDAELRVRRLDEEGADAGPLDL